MDGYILSTIVLLYYMNLIYGACVNGVRSCVDECKRGAGYTICADNKTVTMDIPHTLYCIQNGTNIYLTDICLDPVPKCVEKYPDNHCYECTSGDQRCTSPCECSKGFELCDNGKWIPFPNPLGTVCIQNNAKDIEFLLSCSGNSYLTQCPAGFLGDCKCTNQPKCINGHQRCLSACTCGFGYEECVFGEWVKMKMAAGTICTQSGTHINEVFSCPEMGSQGGCTGKVKGDCNCTSNVECINGNIKCEVECGCGSGLLECSNGKWIKQSISDKDLCVNNGTSAYLVSACPEYGPQGKCSGNSIGDCKCNPNSECIEGDMKCIQQCNCGSGYNECVNGKYVERPLPNGTVCYQLNYNSIVMVPSCKDYGYQSFCNGHITGNCNCTDDASCINGEQQCLSECGCGAGYRECANGKWVAMNISDGTVCAQNGAEIIAEYGCPEYGDQGKCAGKTNCPYCDASPQCVQGDQICVDECGCGSGYKECVGSRWVTRSIATGTVCAQNGSRIIEESSCMSDGSGDTCDHRRHGNCNCPVPQCNDGESRCIDQCQCGVGYQYCIDRQWIDVMVSDNELCYQLTPHYIQMYNNTNPGLCSSEAKGNCMSSLCTFVGSRCIDECEVGRGYELCENLHAEKKTIDIDNNLICKQDDLLHNTIKLNSRHDQKCCFKKNVDYNRGRYCVKSCVVGLGYYDCDDNNKCVEVAIPAQMVCVQKDINDIKLSYAHDRDNYCKGHMQYCKDVISSKNLPKWLDHFMHRHVISENKESNQINLPPNIALPAKGEDYSVGCKYDGSYCYKNCQNSYYVCVDGIRISFDTAPGTLCYQKTKNSIEQIVNTHKICQSENEYENDIQEYPTANSNNTHKTIIPVLNPSYIQCGTLDGHYCQDECGINKGYFYCENSVSQYLMPVPENTVCWQKDVNTIVLVHSDESKGSSFGCSGRIH